MYIQIEHVEQDEKVHVEQDEKYGTIWKRIK